MKSGTLYIVATPIGNLGDITLRALEVLRGVDFVLAEDTRHSGKLLARYEIKTSMVSCHKFNEVSRIEGVMARLESGESAALISDAGTPGISDAGSILVAAAAGRGVDVLPLPGASAMASLMSVAGMELSGVLFLGFLPSRRVARRKALLGLLRLPYGFVLYESPRRVTGLLKDILELLGPRQVVVGREMTKMHEEILRGPVDAVLADLEARESIRGEFALLVAPDEKPESEGLSEEDIPAEVERFMKEEGLSRSDAVRIVAELYNIPRKKVYKKTIRSIAE